MSELQIKRYVSNNISVQHDDGTPFTIGELQEVLAKLVAIGYDTDTKVESIREVQIYAQLPPLEPNLVRQLVFGGL